MTRRSIVLTAIHLPIALWLVVGVAYVGGDWRSDRRRMDFIRFTGEWLIYFVLIALGGGVLIAFTVGTFEAIGLDAEEFINSWLLPCGAMAAVIVSAWLVEAKQSVIENMAPVLTRVFTPLFAAALLAFLVAIVWTSNGIDVERDVLILFDLLLVVVLGLLLYAISARDLAARPGLFDKLAARARRQRVDHRRPGAAGDHRPDHRMGLHARTRPRHWARTSSCSPTWRGRHGCSSASCAAACPSPAWNTGRPVT